MYESLINTKKLMAEIQCWCRESERFLNKLLTALQKDEEYQRNYIDEIKNFKIILKKIKKEAMLTYEDLTIERKNGNL